MTAMRGPLRISRAAIATALPGLAVLAAGCGNAQTVTSRSPTSTSTSTTSAARTPGLGIIAACRGSQLTASYARSNGATGHLELTIALRNVSGTACRLRGYPQAALLDAAGRRLPLRVTRGSSFFADAQAAPRPVVVPPGALAHFGIGLVTNPEYAHAHVCRTADAALAAAPGRPAHWLRVSLHRGAGGPIRPCGSTLAVSPVHA